MKRTVKEIEQFIDDELKRHCNNLRRSDLDTDDQRFELCIIKQLEKLKCFIRGALYDL